MKKYNIYGNNTDGPNGLGPASNKAYVKFIFKFDGSVPIHTFEVWHKHDSFYKDKLPKLSAEQEWQVARIIEDAFRAGYEWANLKKKPKKKKGR